MAPQHRVSATTQLLLDMLCERDALGRAKYGATLDRGDMSAAAWLQHLTEELLDAAGYAQAARRVLLQLQASGVAAPAALPMVTAPKDGSLVRLLVDFDDNPIDQTRERDWTIGCYVAVPGAERWAVVGWDWNTNAFAEARGARALGWSPLGAGPRSAIVPEAETVGADVGGLVGEMLESARELFGDNRITVQFGDNPPHRLAADHPIAGMMLSGAIRIAARGGLSLPAGIFVGFHVVEDSMRLCMRTPDGAEHWREVGKDLIMPGDFG